MPSTLLHCVPLYSFCFPKPVHTTPPLWHTPWKRRIWLLVIRDELSALQMKLVILLKLEPKREKPKERETSWKTLLIEEQTSRTDETKRRRRTKTNRRETSLETSKIQRSGHWVSRKDAVRCSRGLWCHVLVMTPPHWKLASLPS